MSNSKYWNLAVKEDNADVADLYLYNVIDDFAYEGYSDSAESILKDHPALISIFILGDENNKIERIKKIYHLSTEEAKISIYRHDRKRKNYHNYYCKGKWGDSRNYDICVNSTKLGEEMTAKMLAKYIRKRMELW